MTLVPVIARQAERAARLARVLVRTGAMLDVPPLALPAAGWVAARGGINVRTAHTLQAKLHPHRTALVDERYSYTYRELDDAIERIASALTTTLGVAPRETILLAAENAAPTLIVWFAAFRAGIRVAHASYESTHDELAYLGEASGAKCVICSTRSLDAARALAEAAEIPILTVDPPGADTAALPGVFAFDELAKHPRVALSRAGSAANVVFTSGTTGRPKGAVRDFSQMGLLELSGILERLPVKAGERHLTVARLYHAAAQALIWMVTSMGGTNVVMRKFDAASVLKRLHSDRIDSTFMVPTMIRHLLALPEEQFIASPLNLRMLLSGAAPFPQSLREQAIRRFGPHAVLDFYGATELGWVTTIDGAEMLLKPGSIGRPVAGQEVSVRAEDGTSVPAGETGTLFTRSGQQMEGYIGLPVDQNGGWMTVDDLAHLDNEGYIYLDGRSRDMIITGGVNVYPIEIEKVIHGISGVEDVAIVGAPDDKWGETVVAFVVSTSLDSDALATACRDLLSGPKRPRFWHFVDEIPRNPTGKILKNQLRQRLQESP
jgi:fatty-acyl-CoA synthase